MNRHTPEFDQRIADWLEADPNAAPADVLSTVVAALPSIPQARRGLLAPWRFTRMTNFTRAAAGVAIVAIVGVGVLAFNSRSPGAGTNSPAPTLTAAPTAAPSPTSPPTAGPAPTTYVPGALTQTFTSDVHGVSLNYPDGWAAQAATEPWTEGGPPNWSDPTGDKVHDDDALQDHLFLTIVSRPLDGSSLDEWFTEFFADQGCTPRAGGSINGADRVLRGDCVTDIALASSGGRGYVFELRASPDDVELRTLDTAALLDSILATVELHPEDAVDE